MKEASQVKKTAVIKGPSFLFIFLKWKPGVRPSRLYDSFVVTNLLGTLRSDNGDVDENVAEKQTSHHLKLFRDYPASPGYLKEGDFEWSWREGNALKFGQRW